MHITTLENALQTPVSKPTPTDLRSQAKMAINA
jgi:hypothetical protein